MWRGHKLKGAVETFLGTYISRNTGYRGYWLFGQLCPANPVVKIDLLGRDELGHGVREVARWLAVNAFTDQLAKNGLRPSSVAYAHLDIRTIPFPVNRLVAGVHRRGNYVAFDVAAVPYEGEIHRGTRTVFVAPHDPKIERRGSSAEDELLRWTWRE